jgi:transcriptional regulator with XRE-family HTH domain
VKKSLSRRSTIFDAYLGQELRKQRLSFNISQGALAEMAGVTFQQIQKYEKGTNRISASRLYEICNFLKIDVNDLLNQVAEKVKFNIVVKGEVVLTSKKAVADKVSAIRARKTMLNNKKAS